MTSHQQKRAKQRATESLARSLDELDGSLSRSAPETGLTSRIRKACATPLNRLSESQLRVLVSQGVGTRHVLPLALDVLTRTPLLETEFFPGDLLLALRGVGENFWRQNPGDLRRAVRCLEEALQSAVPRLDERASAEATVLRDSLLALVRG